MSDEQEYLLGTDKIELERLKLQHDIWDDWTEKVLDVSGIGSGNKVLDLGAGPGFTSLSLAKRVGRDGHVLATDMSTRFSKHLIHLADDAGASQIEFLQADVHTLELPHQSFDFVFARWVFCFLRSRVDVLARLAKILKPGGKLIIMDYFNYLGVGFMPNHPHLRRGFEAVHQSFGDSGGTLDVGEILPSQLVQNGFRIDSLTPINEISRHGQKHWRWFKTFRDSFFPKLLDSGYLDEHQLAQFDEVLAQREADPGAYFFTPPMLGIVASRI